MAPVNEALRGTAYPVPDHVPTLRQACHDEEGLLSQLVQGETKKAQDVLQDPITLHLIIGRVRHWLLPSSMQAFPHSPSEVVTTKLQTHLALHGHDEDGGGAIADYQLVQILGIGNDDVYRGVTPCRGLRRPERARAVTRLGIPDAHRAVA